MLTLRTIHCRYKVSSLFAVLIRSHRTREIAEPEEDVKAVKVLDAL
jgi:hypothetical protein